MPGFQTGFRTTLAAALTTTATSIVLATAPTATSGRMLIYEKEIEEWISYTGVSSTTLTGVTRRLSQTADPVTGGTGLAWGAGAKVIMVAMHDQLVDKESALPIVGLTTVQKAALSMGSDYFTGTYPIIYDTTLGSYEYWNGSAWTAFATGTVANASATVAGKKEDATSAESIAGTDVGGTGATLAVVPSDIAKNTQSGTFLYGADAGGDDTYVVAYTPVLTVLTIGMELEFTAAFANVGACTLDAGFGGALAIKTPAGNDPSNGDVIIGINKVRYNGTNWTLLNPIQATTAEKGVSEMATDSEAIAITDQTRYINPYQLGLVANPNSFPNTLATSSAYRTYILMPTVGPTADAISNGWVENAATLAASQGGGGIVLFDTAGSADAIIYTQLPGIGANPYFRFADIGANAISIKTSILFGTSPGATEAISFGIQDGGAGGGLEDLEDSTAASTIRFCLADNTGDKLYAVNSNGAANTNTDVTGALTLTSRLNLEMIITSTQVLFYAGNTSAMTLVATHTTNLPTSTNPIQLGWGIIDDGSQPDVYMSPIIISLPTS